MNFVCVSEKSTWDLKEGDVVLMGADNKKRLDWALAKILELIPGKDGSVRVAKLRTEQGVLIRPLQRLYPLEVHGASWNRDIPESIQKIRDGRAKPSEKIAAAEDKPEQEIITRHGRRVKVPSKYTSDIS